MLAPNQHKKQVSEGQQLRAVQRSGAEKYVLDRDMDLRLFENRKFESLYKQNQKIVSLNTRSLRTLQVISKARAHELSKQLSVVGDSMPQGMTILRQKQQADDEKFKNQVSQINLQKFKKFLDQDDDYSLQQAQQFQEEEDEDGTDDGNDKRVNLKSNSKIHELSYQRKTTQNSRRALPLKKVMAPQFATRNVTPSKGAIIIGKNSQTSLPDLDVQDNAQIFSQSESNPLNNLLLLQKNKPKNSKNPFEGLRSKNINTHNALSEYVVRLQNNLIVKNKTEGTDQQQQVPTRKIAKGDLSTLESYLKQNVYRSPTGKMQRENVPALRMYPEMQNFVKPIHSVSGRFEINGTDREKILVDRVTQSQKNKLSYQESAKFIKNSDTKQIETQPQQDYQNDIQFLQQNGLITTPRNLENQDIYQSNIITSTNLKAVKMRLKSNFYNYKQRLQKSTTPIAANLQQNSQRVVFYSKRANKLGIIVQDQAAQRSGPQTPTLKEWSMLQSPVPDEDSEPI